MSKLSSKFALEDDSAQDRLVPAMIATSKVKRRVEKTLFSMSVILEEEALNVEEERRCALNTVSH